METPKQSVANIGRHDDLALARATGSLVESDTTEKKSTPNDPSERRSRMPETLLALGAIGATAWLSGAFSGDNEPSPLPATYAEQSADAAKKSYNPATDTIVIGGMRIQPGNPKFDTPSEAVLGNSEVKQYEAANPDEVSSITSSALALDVPDGATIGLVERDIDGDGDKDAVAVEIKDQ